MINISLLRALLKEHIHLFSLTINDSSNIYFVHTKCSTAFSAQPVYRLTAQGRVDLTQRRR